ERKKMRRPQGIPESPRVHRENVSVIARSPCTVTIAIDRARMFAFFDEYDRRYQNIHGWITVSLSQVQLIREPSDAVRASSCLSSLQVDLVVLLTNVNLHCRCFEVMTVMT